MQEERKTIKCIVWDLDNTLWNGVLLENDEVSLRDKVTTIIKTLDRRGILQSIASRNDETRAIQKLIGFGLYEYFLYPQISWDSKVVAIKTIAKYININFDSIAFIDDQEYEREEVKYSLSEVLCLDAADLDQLLNNPEMNPRFITDDSKKRRQLYLDDIVRNKVEQEFVGPKVSFLASLHMALTIFLPTEHDLQRAEELTIRTNQLNTTGKTYNYDELNHFRQSDQYQLLMVKLEDKFGSYGNVGLALLENKKNVWTIKLMLMSCRVMSRGVGPILLNHIMKASKNKSIRLLAEFIPNDCNRLMQITYQFAGFCELKKVGNMILYESNLENIQPFPDYIKILILYDY